MAVLTVRDETMTGKETASFIISDLPDSISVRDLIRWRVREEVARYNARPTNSYNGLVQPIDSEVGSHGFEMRRPRRLDWEKQAAVATEAFAKNGFVVLVGDRQVEELDEMVDLDGDLAVAFVRLVPLVGG